MSGKQIDIESGIEYFLNHLNIFNQMIGEKWEKKLNYLKYKESFSNEMVDKLSDKACPAQVTICNALQVEKKVVATCKAEDLVGLKAQHPFIENLQVPVLADQFVGLTDGTAVVHCAPGCGPEDYEMGLRYN